MTSVNEKCKIHLMIVYFLFANKFGVYIKSDDNTELLFVFYFFSGTECSVEGKPHVEWSQTGCEGDSTETRCNPKQSL